MAIVGIVGGLGPESTIDYYRRIIEAWERDAPSTAPSIVMPRPNRFFVTNAVGKSDAHEPDDAA
jgi:aspartate/glutamate racemase